MRIFDRWLVGLAALSLLLAAVLWVGGEAGAATAGPSMSCVSRGELAKLEGGETRREVVALLDGPGRPAPLYATARVYRPCGRSWDHHRVLVRYGKAGRLWYAVTLSCSCTLL